ncbi:MAG: hypothetical protein ACJ0BB_03880 [Dehalococcoidia bacterium]
MQSNSDIKLYNYVNNQIPKLKIMQTSDLESMFENFSPEKIVETSSLTSNEVIESFRLSLITESLTEQYAETYKIGADMYDAQWLNNFVKGFWEPDELGHADPFKNILIDFGINQKDLEIEIGDAKSSIDYQTEHSSGFHPVALTTYGMIQECITDYWYELQRKFFPTNSNTYKVLSQVKGREALHTVQFRDLTALQLEKDPNLLEHIIHAAVAFEMPSNHIPAVKEIEAKTREWIPQMNGSVSELLRRIINNINLVLDDNSKTGKLILEYASNSEKQFFQLIPNRIIINAISNIRGGTSLVGEIVLDQLGLKGSEEQSPKTYIEEVQFRLKNILKRWAKEKLSIEGFISPSSKRIS